VTITNGSGAAAEAWQKIFSPSLASATYTRLVSSGRRISGANVRISAIDTIGNPQAANTHSGTAFDWKDSLITSGFSINKVIITLDVTTAGASGEADIAAIEKSTSLDLTGDLVGLNVSRYLGWRVGLAEIGLQDFGDTYWNASNISSADILLLYAGTTTATLTKIFGGIVNKKKKPGILNNRYTILDCLDWTKALEAVVVDKRYVASQEDVIVDDLRDIVNGVAASPYNNDTYWRLSEQAITDVLNKTYTLEWRQLTAMDALTELAEIVSIDTASGKGADFVVYPSAWFNWDEIGDTGFTDHGTFGETLYQSFDPDISLDDLRTQVNLIGKIQMPTGGDEWSESDASNWTVRTGTGSVVDDSGNKQVGANALKLDTNTANTLAIDRDAGGIFRPSRLGNEFLKPQFSFWARYDLGATINEDTDDYRIIPYVRTSGGTNFAGDIVNLKGEIGKQLEWKKVYSDLPLFDSDVTRVGLTWETNVSESHLLWIDGLRIEGKVIEIAKDTRTGKGEGQYGKRELTIYDPTPRQMTSTTGAQGHRERARAELFKWRDEIVNARLFMKNKLNIHPADKLAITSVPHNYSAKAFRVIGSHYFWVSGMSSIDSTFDLTDFMVTTFPHGAGDLYGLLIRQGFLGRYETLLTALRENEILGGMNVTTTSYS